MRDGLHGSNFGMLLTSSLSLSLSLSLSYNKLISCKLFARSEWNCGPPLPPQFYNGLALMQARGTMKRWTKGGKKEGRKV